MGLPSERRSHLAACNLSLTAHPGGDPWRMVLWGLLAAPCSSLSPCARLPWFSLCSGASFSLFWRHCNWPGPGRLFICKAHYFCTNANVTPVLLSCRPLPLINKGTVFCAAELHFQGEYRLWQAGNGVVSGISSCAFSTGQLLAQTATPRGPCFDLKSVPSNIGANTVGLSLLSFLQNSFALRSPCQKSWSMRCVCSI